MRASVVFIGGLALAGVGFGAGYLVRDSRAVDDAQRAEQGRAVLDHKLRTVEMQLSESRKANEEAVEAANREHARSAEELAQLQARLKETEAKAAEKIAAAVKQRDPASQGKGAGLFKAFSEMMKDPKFVEASKGQQVAMLDVQYGKLFDRFKLSDE